MLSLIRRAWWAQVNFWIWFFTGERELEEPAQAAEVHEGAVEDWAPIEEVGALPPLTEATKAALIESTAEFEVICSVEDELGYWEPDRHAPLEPVLFYSVAERALRDSAITVPVSVADFVAWTMYHVLGPSPATA